MPEPSYISPQNLSVVQVDNEVILTWDPMSNVNTSIIHYRMPATGEHFDPYNLETQLAHTSDSTFTYVPPQAGSVDYQVFGVFVEEPAEPPPDLIYTLRANEFWVEYRFGSPNLQQVESSGAESIVANSLNVNYTFGSPELAVVPTTGLDSSSWSYWIEVVTPSRSFTSGSILADIDVVITSDNHTEGSPLSSIYAIPISTHTSGSNLDVVQGAQALPVPSGWEFTANVDPDTPQLSGSWNSVVGASGYSYAIEVEIGGNWSTLYTGFTTSTSFTRTTNVQSNTRYRARVRADA